MKSLNRSVLISNLIGAAPWLALLTVMSWPLGLMATGYVLASSLYFALVYSRDLSGPVRFVAWLVPGVAAVALWAWVLRGGVITDGTLLDPLIIGTVCYLLWQASAWVVGEFTKSKQDDYWDEDEEPSTPALQTQ